MLEMLGFLLGAALTTGAVGVGYVGTKRFVRRRLRYVDEVQSPTAPLISGTVAALVAAPVVAVLPLVGAPTALLFGVAVGAGTRAGARENRYLGGG